MNSFSVVIVCKNEAEIIASSLQSLAGLTDDIVVYDTGSSDGTQTLVKQLGLPLHEGSWEGYGRTKNKAAQLARYNWILSLDADEGVDDTLRESLKKLEPGNESTVYDIRRRNFLGKHYLRFGHWGRDHLIRFFNRKKVSWNDDAVHEKLNLPAGTSIKKINGFILHHSIRDFRDYSEKMLHYAFLGAEKYYQAGRKATWLRIYISPCFNFFSNYILKLGFLDGYAGYVTAKMTSWYTFLKYAQLKALREKLK